MKMRSNQIWCNYHKGRKEVFGNTRVNENKFQKYTHPNPLSKMIPRAVQIKSGIKPLTFARKVNNAYLSHLLKVQTSKQLLQNLHKQGKEPFKLKRLIISNSGCLKRNQQFQLFIQRLPLQGF